MSVEDFMSGIKDPAVWGGITAAVLVNNPLLRRFAYFVVGVATAKFTGDDVATVSGATTATAQFLVAFFGFLILEKIASIITSVDPKEASKEAWTTFLGFFKRG